MTADDMLARASAENNRLRHEIEKLQRACSGCAGCACCEIVYAWTNRVLDHEDTDA